MDEYFPLRNNHFSKIIPICCILTSVSILSIFIFVCIKLDHTLNEINIFLLSSKDLVPKLNELLPNLNEIIVRTTKSIPDVDSLILQVNQSLPIYTKVVSTLNFTEIQGDLTNLTNLANRVAKTFYII